MTIDEKYEAQQWQDLGWTEGFWTRDDAGEFETIEAAAAWARREAGRLYGDAVRGFRVTRAGTDDVVWEGRNE